jgi:hypothetical protein
MANISEREGEPVGLPGIAARCPSKGFQAGKIRFCGARGKIVHCRSGSFVQEHRHPSLPFTLPALRHGTAADSPADDTPHSRHAQAKVQALAKNATRAALRLQAHAVRNVVPGSEKGLPPQRIFCKGCAAFPSGHTPCLPSRAAKDGPGGGPGRQADVQAGMRCEVRGGTQQASPAPPSGTILRTTAGDCNGRTAAAEESATVRLGGRLVAGRMVTPWENDQATKPTQTLTIGGNSLVTGCDQADRPPVPLT